MAPRTILYTGKGGVGKTSVAAASARRCAAAGARTLVLSTDPAHSLSDSLELDVGREPTAVGKRLWAQQVQAQEELERNWSAVQEWLGGVLAERGVQRIAAEELTVPPGGTVSSSAAMRSTPRSISRPPSQPWTDAQLRSSSDRASTCWAHKPSATAVGAPPTTASSESANECAGSVDSTIVRRPPAAQRRAVAAATDVLPTPPLPV